MTAVRVAVQAAEIRNHARADWIEMEIPHEFQEVRLLLHQDGLVPVLEEMAAPPMPAVESPRVAREEGTHGAREGLARGPD
jgi:hypothetical protein